MIRTTLITSLTAAAAILTAQSSPASAHRPLVLLPGQTHAQVQALEALCRIGLIAGGPWRDGRINRAIATLAWGDPKDWPDHPQATAYKTCPRYNQAQ